MASMEPQSISEWFDGRNVFITGGTGYMGKVLIYKLLVSCHNIGKIYVLIRKKKDQDPQTRLVHMMQQEPFKGIKEKYPERLKKIILIPGDTTVEDLALSTADKERMLQDVSVIFHMAANVKFDLTLKVAVQINTVGTKNVLDLAKQMSKLDVFIHVSTTYCQCMERVLEERNYPASVGPEIVIDMVNNLKDDVLLAMTPKLLEGQPNTYAFTKALSEDLVQRCGLRVGIVRPSIVLPSVKEPMTGWVDNINGPTGLMIAAGKGVLRTMLMNEKMWLRVIPCDMAINATIALAWKIGIEKPVEPIYMNVTTGPENAISWGSVLDIGRKLTMKYPFTGILWYPGGSPTTSKFYHWIRLILFQLIPAYFLDAVIVLSGNKPFLVRVQQKLSAGLEIVQYYTTKQWDFRNDRVRQLQYELNTSDRDKFLMDPISFKWEQYLVDYILGARQHYLKDDPSTLPRARKVIKYLYYADWFVKIVMTLLFSWFVYSWISPARELTTTTFEINEI
ncbi:putative fatty acyl-CoA reductase CG5065 [Halictus rubicundus]|uniref:putative fatty acyl-CoA reductase CG5065 n=1 Tax=Halictus rubicundus TaxID=77578 RepID=UPI004035C64A